MKHSILEKQKKSVGVGKLILQVGVIGSAGSEEYIKGWKCSLCVHPIDLSESHDPVKKAIWLKVANAKWVLDKENN